MDGPAHLREAERLAKLAHNFTYGDGSSPATGAALAAEAQAHAAIAAVYLSVDVHAQSGALVGPLSKGWIQLLD